MCLFFNIHKDMYFAKVGGYGYITTFITENLFDMRVVFTFFMFLTQLLCVIAQLPSYYQSIDFSQSESQVQVQLKSLITTTHNPLQYADTYPWVRYADEDETNTANVILMYNGQSISKLHTIGGGNDGAYPEIWNREHVYPQSLIGTTAAADLHHLRACDAIINNNRGNLPFAPGNGAYGTVAGGYYPGDEWKGDVARMVMYVYLRYNEPFEDVGNLTLFLQWNVEDPVSDFERQRNNRIQEAQGNRNPFIDQPYLATYFWGGTAAEDTWGWPNMITEPSYYSTLTCFPNPASTEITISGFTDVVKPGTLTILNCIGEVVYQESAFASNQEIRLPLHQLQLSKGLYVVQFNNEGANSSTKFMVE
jgi:endonuclease I